MSTEVTLSIAEHFTNGLPNSAQLNDELALVLTNLGGFTITPDADEFVYYFVTPPTESDLTILMDTIHAHTPVYPSTYTISKTYTTGKLQIKNTSFTVLDKIIFKGSVPIKFSVNSYSSSSSGSYSVRFVNVATKEIMAEATFNNTGDEDVMEVGEYTTILPSETVVIEIQGKTNSSGNKAFIEGVVLDYN